MLPGLLSGDQAGDLMEASTGGFSVEGKILIGREASRNLRHCKIHTEHLSVI
jgi:hypothetical protein